MNQAQQQANPGGQPQQEQMIVLPMSAVNRIGEIAMEAPTKFGGPILEILRSGQVAHVNPQGNEQAAGAQPAASSGSNDSSAAGSGASTNGAGEKPVLQ